MSDLVQVALNHEKENIVSHALSSETNIYSNLNSSEQGLSTTQYQSNTTTFGKNIIQNKESRKMSHIILEAFFTPFNTLLITIAIIDTIINVFNQSQSPTSIAISFVLIIVLVTVAAIIKIVFELKAKRINEQLHSNISTKHTVLRDGEQIQVLHDDITVGDIIYFHIGDIVPADVRILSSCDLSITQSSLTGESSSIDKNTTVSNDITALSSDILHISNIIYKGSSIVAGSGQGIVFATGNNTYVGQMVEKIKTKRHMTYFERSIYRLTFLLSVLAIIACVILFLIKTLFARYQIAGN
jgi:Mg2+-importing ATPase